jgi:hypothetical protein
MPHLFKHAIYSNLSTCLMSWFLELALKLSGCLNPTLGSPMHKTDSIDQYCGQSGQPHFILPSHQILQQTIPDIDIHTPLYALLLLNFQAWRSYRICSKASTCTQLFTNDFSFASCIDLLRCAPDCRFTIVFGDVTSVLHRPQVSTHGH